MSISKKKAGVILLIIAVIGFGYWLFHEDEVVPDFSSNNKIELIAHVLRNRNADKIREAGYGIPSDSVIRRLGGIDMLEMDGELNLKVRVPSPDDSEILVLFSTVDDGKKINGTFFLDKEWNIIYSSYHTIGEDNTRKEVKLTDSQEKELLQKVQITNVDLAFIRKKGRREIRVGCRKNRRCRGAVMKGRDMRSYVSRSVTDEQAFKKCRS